MTKVSKKSHYLLGASALAVMLSLNTASGFTDSPESRTAARSGFAFDVHSFVNLQAAAQHAAVALYGVYATAGVDTTLATGITRAQNRLGQTNSITADMDVVTTQVSGLTGSSLAATDLYTESGTLFSRVSGSVGGDITTGLGRANGALDGVAGMEGITTLTITSAAVNPSGNIVRMIFDDGNYDLDATGLTVANNGTFKLTNTNTNTITLINRSGGSLVGQAGVLAYLSATNYPVGQVIKRNTLSKSTALETLIGGAAKGSTQRILAIDALLGTVTGSDINTKVTNLLYQMDQGVSAMPTAITSMTVSTKAVAGTGNRVEIVFNDGTPAQTYRLADGSISIASGSTFDLLEVGGGTKTLTLYNRSGGALATQAAFVEYLQNLYPTAAVISPNDTTIVAAVNALLGGTAVGVRSRAAAIWGLLKATPVTDVSTDLASLRTYIVGTPGATLQDDLNILAQALTGADASSGSTLQSRIASSNGPQDGVSSLGTITSFSMTGAGAAVAAVSGNYVQIVGTDNLAATQTYRVDTTGTGINITVTPIAIGATFTLTNSATPANTITLVNTSGGALNTQAGLRTFLAAAYPFNAVMSANAPAKATALQTLIGGSAFSAMGNAATVDDLLLTAPTGVIATDLATVRSSINNTLGATAQADVTTVSGKLSGINASITANTDLYRRLTDANSGVTSGLLAKFNATQPATVMAGLDALAAQMDGSAGASLTGVASTVGNLNDKLAGQITAVKAAGTQLSTVIAAVNTAIGGSGTGLEAMAIARRDALKASETSIATAITALQAQVAGLTGAEVNAMLANGIGVVKSGATVMKTATDAVNAAIGGTGTGLEAMAIARAAAIETGATVIDTAITDVNTILGGAGAGIHANVGLVNTTLGGAGTANARATTILNAILASGNTNAAADIASLEALIAGAGATLQARATVVATHIDGSDATSGVLDTKLGTQIVAIKAAGTQLSTVIGQVNTALGGAGTTDARTTAVKAAILGTPVDAIADLATLAGLIAATPSGVLQTDVNTLLSRVDGTTGGVAETKVIAERDLLQAAQTTLTAARGNINTVLGAAGATTYVKATAAQAKLLTTPGASINADIGTLAALIAATPGATVQADIQTINSLLNGTASGSTTQARIGAPLLGGAGSNLLAMIGGVSTDVASALGDPGAAKTLIDNIGGSTTSVQAALDALSTILVNSTSFGSSLTTQATTQSTNLDNGLSSLPGGGTYATIGTAAASDGSGGVNIVIGSGLGGANGTYNLPSGTITGGIANGSSFTLINGGNNLVLINRSGSTISTQAQAIRYLTSMYPATSKIAAGLSDKISSGLNVQLGGSATSVRARLAAVDAALLTTPTGVMSTDLASMRALLVSSLGATAQADIQTINTLLNGTATGSTAQARISSVLDALLTTPTNVVDDIATLRAKIVASLNATAEEDVGSVASLVDGSTGAVVTGAGGVDISFGSYSGTTSQVFADENVTVSSNTVTVNIGGENYTYSTSTSNINNSDSLTFTGSGSKTLVLTYAGGGISNGNANANASDLQSAIVSFFQAGSTIAPRNLAAKMGTLRQLADGAVTPDVKTALSTLRTSIDGSSGFRAAGTTGADFTVPAYNGTTSQVFGAGAFADGASTTISVTIGTDTYTYDNTGVTNIGGYGTIRFTSGSKSLIAQNATGALITADTDQHTADAIVTALNGYFGNGSSIMAADLTAKVGTPGVALTSLKAMLGSSAEMTGAGQRDIVSMLGNTGGGDVSLAAVIGNPGADTSQSLYARLTAVHSSLAPGLTLGVDSFSSVIGKPNDVKNAAGSLFSRLRGIYFNHNGTDLGWTDAWTLQEAIDNIAW